MAACAPPAPSQAKGLGSRRQQTILLYFLFLKNMHSPL